MAESSRVTLSDIAERLDLTKVSISKALRDHPDISTETKAKVQEAAREMGYTPNRLARSLTTNRTATIGVVVPKLDHNFFADALQGINERASEHDYEIILCVSEEQEAAERRHLRTLLSMQVDGLLISVSEETESVDIFEQIEEEEVPLVFFDRVLDSVSASRVVVDDEKGAYQATEHALQAGHDTIAHVAGTSNVGIGQRRRAGYEAALREYGIPVDEALIVEGGFDEMHGYRGTNALLERGRVPDAIFAVTFPVALGVGDAIREQDHLRQEDIQIYSFGQHGLNRFFAYPHVSICQPAQKMGREAFSMLLDEMRDPTREPREIQIPTHVIEPDDITPPYLKERGEG